MRALIVDDSPAMRVLIKRVLQLSGYEFDEVSEASHGQEALDRLSESPVDVMLSDINMPVMDGEQLLSKLYEQGRMDGLCVVVVSTDATCGRMERMLKFGARGYVTKPFTPEAMREVLDHALEGQNV